MKPIMAFLSLEVVALAILLSVPRGTLAHCIVAWTVLICATGAVVWIGTARD